MAVIGGGCAAIAAAFELSRPVHEGRYEITIYQEGFRLGGKGASGRGPAERIEEHGLHLWMGFYENAFRLMRECYAEAARDPRSCRIADWQQAFFPSHHNAVADHTRSGAWEAWGAHFPPMPGLPGDPPEQLHTWTVGDYMRRVLELLRTLLLTIQLRAYGAAAPPPATPATPTSADGLLDAITQLVRFGRLAGFGGLLQALRFLDLAVSMVPRLPEGALSRLIELIADSARREVEALVAGDDELRRLWEIADCALACVRGGVRFRLMTDPRGFDCIDDYDCREWLLLNGASLGSVNSAFVRGLYDLGFAFEGGDVTRPRIAAGQALRASFRAFFSYRGAFFWKMSAGMGDVVFAPFWEVLRERGVRFEFFHRLTDVRIAEPDGPGQAPYVRALELDVQAAVRGGGEYMPLIDVRGLPCWPAEPLWEQLEQGEAWRAQGRDFESHWDRRRVARRTLEVGRDFDFVVLGVGVGAIPHVCKEILARDERWRGMVEHVTSVQTQALQIWLRDSMPELGWTGGAVNLSGFVEPFDTWADMSHLVHEESHTEPVRAIAYFCSVLPDPGPDEDPADAAYPKRATARVRENAAHFLSHDLVKLWPKAAAAGGFRWEALSASGGEGEARLDSQYVRANVNPSERYALSLPGSLRYRISPLDATYDNLTICGDWTDCGFNEGCVEAAVMSGRLAAHAISKSPPLSEIVGFDHP